MQQQQLPIGAASASALPVLEGNVELEALTTVHRLRGGSREVANVCIEKKVPVLEKKDYLSDGYKKARCPRQFPILVDTDYFGVNGVKKTYVNEPFL